MSISPSVFNSAIRKARKPHKCCECHEVINIGDRYQYSSGIWDGEPDSYKQCLNCGTLFEAVSNDCVANGFADCSACFGHLRDFLIDMDCDKPDVLVEYAESIGVEASLIAHLMKSEVVA